VSVTVAELVAACERLWPSSSGAEEWDNTGLLVGRLSSPVSKVLFVVDVVADTVIEAIEGGYDAIIAHHPLILRGVSSVAESTYKGNLIAKLIRNEISVLAMHTNADVVVNGVSDVFARKLGIQNAAPIIATAGANVGLGRVGDLASSITLGELASSLASLLPATVPGVQVAGDFSAVISRVSLCGGAGDSLLDHPEVVGSDVYITSDLRHHRASEAREQARISGGPALMNVSHWASEWLWLEAALESLGSTLPGLELAVSDIRTDPWDFVVTQ